MRYVGVKCFELLWEKYTFKVTCELYVGSGRVDTWPKPILFLLRTYFVSVPDNMACFLLKQMSETVVSHGILWER